MSQAYIFEVYDGDKKIFEGTRQQVFMHFDMCYETSITIYYKYGSLLKGKYKVVKTDRTHIEPKKKKSKYQEDLDYLVEHLTRYGNTVMLNDPRKYIPALEELGLKVKVSDWIIDRSNTVVLNDIYSKEYRKRMKPDQRQRGDLSHYIELIGE